MAINLKPFRVYDEHDVINLYAYSGSIGLTAGDKVPKGTLVKVQGDGWKNTDEPTEMLGSPGASYNGTVSQRYGSTAKICQTSSGNVALGVLLHDIAEVDENGELLKFNPRKAAEMEVAISGQSAPVLSRGILLYSGDSIGTVTPGTKLFAGDSGEIIATNGDSAGYKVGHVLGASDTDGYALIKLEL
tara:strand:- start:183 stop:746 length:564 start_codon:yes stop_codon:yes gene_type:complete